MNPKPLEDKIVFGPENIKKYFRPVGKDIGRDTFILGVFNPGVARLKNRNVLLMVRVAEALNQPEQRDSILSPRMDFQKKKFVLDAYSKKSVDFKDPRYLKMGLPNETKAIRLTSLSWLLPVELNSNGTEIVTVHYDKVILPSIGYQEFGIEDPRITKIRNKYRMTVVCVSSNRICTALYESRDGIDYKTKGMIFEHCNKDVVLFPEKIKGKYFALTRPEGSELYLTYPSESDSLEGTFIAAAKSLDLQYWMPCEKIVLNLKKKSLINKRIGAGAPPISVTIKGKKYFLALFNGVEYEKRNPVGIYRTFAALLDKDDPTRVVKVNYKPLLESNTKLEKHIKSQLLLKHVVFATGIISDNNNYLVYSGELDTAVRVTIFSKKQIHTFINGS